MAMIFLVNKILHFASHQVQRNVAISTIYRLDFKKEKFDFDWICSYRIYFFFYLTIEIIFLKNGDANLHLEKNCARCNYTSSYLTFFSVPQQWPLFIACNLSTHLRSSIYPQSRNPICWLLDVTSRGFTLLLRPLISHRDIWLQQNATQRLWYTARCAMLHLRISFDAIARANALPPRSTCFHPHPTPLESRHNANHYSKRIMQTRYLIKNIFVLARSSLLLRANIYRAISYPRRYAKSAADCTNQTWLRARGWAFMRVLRMSFQFRVRLAHQRNLRNRALVNYTPARALVQLFATCIMRHVQRE